MTVANVFTNNNTAALLTSSGTLVGTQQLTNTSATVADAILVKLNATEDEAIANQVKNSMSDMSVLDKLINDNYDLNEIGLDFLKAIDEATLDSMLKSQQSKRSRCKSKEMTVDNYKSMMTAAIAEMLIRQASGKEKGTFTGRMGTAVFYSPERLEKLAADQEALRKEIRNVQSKKSILKSKAGFVDTDERWLALLVAEEQLKSIRQDVTTVVVAEVDPLRIQLQELLAEVDEEAMSAKNLKALVASIKDFVWPVEPEATEEV